MAAAPLLIPSDPFLEARYGFLKTFWTGQVNGYDLHDAPFLEPKGPPRLYVEALARQSLEVLQEAMGPEQVCLGIASVVVCGRRIFQIPKNTREALNMLNLLSGRRHRIYTAFVLEHEGKTVRKTVETRVKLKVLSLSEREELAQRRLFGGYLPLQPDNHHLIQGVYGCHGNLWGHPALELRNALVGMGLAS